MSEPAAPSPPEVYEREMVPAQFARWAPELVDAAGVRRGDRVLDVACGTGVVTRLVAARLEGTGRVVGLDMNPGMLAVARTVTAGLPIEWHEANALALPFPDGSFDVVLCQQGMQFFPDRVAGLREMRRVLVPGGRLALACWLPIARQTAFRALEEALGRRIGPEQAKLPPFGLGDRATLRGYLEAAGLADIRVRAEVLTSRYPSAAHFVRAITGGAPGMLGLLSAQGPEAMAGIIAEVTEATREWVDDEGLGFPQGSHLATARR
jgi:SAM-dependent methyltransferase